MEPPPPLISWQKERRRRFEKAPYQLNRCTQSVSQARAPNGARTRNLLIHNHLLCLAVNERETGAQMLISCQRVCYLPRPMTSVYCFLSPLTSQRA